MCKEKLQACKDDVGSLLKLEASLSFQGKEMCRIKRPCDRKRLLGRVVDSVQEPKESSRVAPPSPHKSTRRPSAQSEMGVLVPEVSYALRPRQS